MALGRFDGLNNEVMIETPYAYHYIGRPDRTAEIVRAVMRYHFIDSAGGLPGNDDSGALSAWYVWNTIGLFPVPGRGIFLIGSPTIRHGEIDLGSRTMTVEVESKDAVDSVFPSGIEGDEDSRQIIYPTSVELNGIHLDRSYLTYREVLEGGKLAIRLGGDPKAFRPKRPPSSGC